MARLGWLLVLIPALVNISHQETVPNLSKEIIDVAACPGKITEECRIYERKQKAEDIERVTCCAYAQVTRCVETLVQKMCPSIPFRGIILELSGSVDASHCIHYTYWSPSCIYNNYFTTVIIGSILFAAGIIALISCFLLCNCCCRKK